MIELQDLLPFTKKLKLLCIDSDTAVRQSLVKTFSKVFAQVDDAADGYDGLNHFRINQHDLVITESSLDNYPALQMVEQIKKNISFSAYYCDFQQTRCIYLTCLEQHGYYRFCS